MRGAFLAALCGFGLVSGACRGKETDAPGKGCRGMCGEGTKCHQGQCIIDYLACTPGSYDDPGDDEGMRPPIDDWGKCKDNLASLPEFEEVDDAHVPQFDPEGTRSISMSTGDEQLAEDVINVHMRDVEYALNECFSRAACYNQGSFPTGEVSFTFRLKSSGDVESVKIDAPEEFNIFGAIPCARIAIYEHQFPSYDGPNMTINYSVELL